MWIRFLNERDHAFASSRPTRGFRGRSRNSGPSIRACLATVRKLSERCSGVGCHVFRHRHEKAVIPQLCPALGLVEHFGWWLRDAGQKKSGQAVYRGEKGLLPSVETTDFLRESVDAGGDKRFPVVPI